MKTMLRLGATRDELTVVADQIGSPTAADDIADAIVRIAGRLLAGTGDFGTFHMTGSGETSWYGFAQAIFAQLAANGQKVPAVKPIPAKDYPTPARRPANSRLDCSKLEWAYGIRLPHWQTSLERCVAALLRTSTLAHVS